MGIRNINILDRKYIKAGETIIEQGVLGSNAYVIAKGRVEVLAKTNNGEIIQLAELGPGSLIGELAVRGGGQRDTTVRAIEETTLISISARDFKRVGGMAGRKGPLSARLKHFFASFFLWLVK